MSADTTSIPIEGKPLDQILVKVVDVELELTLRGDGDWVKTSLHVDYVEMTIDVKTGEVEFGKHELAPFMSSFDLKLAGVRPGITVFTSKVDEVDVDASVESVPLSMMARGILDMKPCQSFQE